MIPSKEELSVIQKIGLTVLGLGIIALFDFVFVWFITTVFM